MNVRGGAECSPFSLAAISNASPQYHLIIPLKVYIHIHPEGRKGAPYRPFEGLYRSILAVKTITLVACFTIGIYDPDKADPALC